MFPEHIIRNKSASNSLKTIQVKPFMSEPPSFNTPTHSENAVTD